MCSVGSFARPPQDVRCCIEDVDTFGCLLTGDAPRESRGDDLVAGAVFPLCSHVRPEAAVGDKRHDQCDGDVDDQDCLTTLCACAEVRKEGMQTENDEHCRDPCNCEVHVENEATQLDTATQTINTGNRAKCIAAQNQHRGNASRNALPAAISDPTLSKPAPTNTAPAAKMHT